MLTHFFKQYQNITFVNTTVDQKNVNFLPKLRFYSWQPLKGQACSSTCGRADAQAPVDAARRSPLHVKARARGKMGSVCSRLGQVTGALS